MVDREQTIYFKRENSYGTGDTWTVYSKVIHDNGDGETCQVFTFQTTTRDSHFAAGLDMSFVGWFDTNRYRYYADLGDECRQQEFEDNFKIFMNNFNVWTKSIFQ